MRNAYFPGNSSSLAEDTHRIKIYPWMLIASGALVVLVVVVCARLAFGIILPFMRVSLGLSYQQAGTLGTTSALGYLVMLLIVGRFASRHGARLSVMVGILFTIAGFTGLAFFSDYRILLALMVLLGIGTAFSYTPVISLLATWFPERRGTVIGLANSGVGIGILLAGELIPFLQTFYGDNGWRLAWTTFSLTAVLAFCGVLVFIRNPPSTKFSSTSLISEKKRIYHDQHVLNVGMLYCVVGVSYIVQAVFMYSFAIDTGLSPVVAGRLAAASGFLSIFSSFFWGTLSDRLGRATILKICTAVVFVAMIIPVLWPALIGFTLHYLLLGCTFLGMVTTILATATETVAPNEAPLAVSFVTLFYGAGQLIGPAAAGMLIEHAGGFRVAFGASSAVLMLGLFLACRLRSYDKTVL